MLSPGFQTDDEATIVLAQRGHWLVGLCLLVGAGMGFVYSAGRRVQSTTTPLYAFLLAGLGGLWGDMPRLGQLIS